jgi:hypothetical protein
MPIWALTEVFSTIEAGLAKIGRRACPDCVVKPVDPAEQARRTRRELDDPAARRLRARDHRHLGLEDEDLAIAGGDLVARHQLDPSGSGAGAVLPRRHFDGERDAVEAGGQLVAEGEMLGPWRRPKTKRPRTRVRGHQLFSRDCSLRLLYNDIAGFRARGNLADVSNGEAALAGRRGGDIDPTPHMALLSVQDQHHARDVPATGQRNHLIPIALSEDGASAQGQEPSDQ